MKQSQSPLSNDSSRCSFEIIDLKNRDENIWIMYFQNFKSNISNFFENQNRKYWYHQRKATQLFHWCREKFPAQKNSPILGQLLLFTTKSSIGLLSLISIVFGTQLIYDLFRPTNCCGDICNNFGPSMDRLDTQHWFCYKFFCTFYFHDSCYDSSTSLLPSNGSK